MLKLTSWLSGLALVYAVVLSSCAEPILTCASDEDCPDGSRCDVELSACFAVSLEDGGATGDGGSPDDGGSPTFAFGVTPLSPEIVQGESLDINVRLERIDGFSAEVEVTLVEMPSGMSATPIVIGSTESSGTITVKTTGATPVGPASLGFRATGGGLEKSFRQSIDVRPSPELSIDIVSPSGDLATNGAVSIQLTVTGGTPDSVELLVDGTPVATLESPYEQLWDTSSVSEGEHLLSARAIKAGKTYTGPQRKVIVDRTPPTVLTRSPSPGSPNVSVTAAISATFSEALDPSTVGDASVSLSSGGKAVLKTVSLSSNGQALTITPSSPLVPPATWTITFTGIKDFAGNAL